MTYFFRLKKKKNSTVPIKLEYLKRQPRLYDLCDLFGDPGDKFSLIRCCRGKKSPFYILPNAVMPHINQSVYAPSELDYFFFVCVELKATF